MAKSNQFFGKAEGPGRCPKFLRSDSKIDVYLLYPKFLSELGLNETTKKIYVLLLNRARLSISNGWTDESGNIYILYRLKNLAADCGKSVRSVSSALRALENADLICRTGPVGKSRAIYVKTLEENCAQLWKKTSNDYGRKLPTNKNNIININNKYYTCEEGESL